MTDEPGSAFVFCTQNHDQVGNRPFGERLNHQIDAGRYAAAVALLLFAPETPMLFMGQEFAASTPFLFFTDFNPELGRLVTEGRRGEFADFRAFADPDMRDSIPDPQAESTFLASKLDLDRTEDQRADLSPLPGAAGPAPRRPRPKQRGSSGDSRLRGRRPDRGRASLAGDRASRARRELRRGRQPATRRYAGA